MRSLNAAPFAALFLILVVCALVCLVQPRGFLVKIAYPAKECGEGFRAVIHVSADGVRFNGEKLELRALDERLRKVFERVSERLVFLKADANLPFQQVARVIDSIQPRVAYVAILTPSAERESDGCLSIRMPLSMDYNFVKPLLEMKEVPWWRWW